MKKNLLIVILLTVCAGCIFAQKKQKESKGEKPAEPVKEIPKEVQKEQNPQTDPIAGQIAHYQKKYNVAVRFNDFDVAKDAIYDILVENPSNDSLLVTLGALYYENQKYPPAVLVSQELLNRNPRNPSALELSAGSYEALQIFDRALQSYESHYLLTNAYPSLYKMAFLQYDLKRLKESSATSDILLAKTESNELKVTFNNAENKPTEYPIKVAILNLKGLLAQETGDKAGAKKYFEQALAIAPDFVPSKQNISKIK